MSASQTILPVINALINTLPDAVLVLSKERGKIVEANNAFLEETGITKDDLISEQLARVPFFSRQVRHGLIRLFLQALRNDCAGRSFRFEYVTSDQTLRGAVAYASRFSVEDRIYVLFTFKDDNPPARETPRVAEAEMESWTSYLQLAYEPYMEFRASVPLLPPVDSDDRIPFLKLASSSLQVKHANNAAVELYAEHGDSLTGRSFVSFFNREDDAFRFLDMLSIVGQMKAETAMIAPGNQIVQVEMNCLVRFDDNGAIFSIYCSQRDLSGARRYEALLGGSRIEMDFTFNQPFVGLAFMTPSHPLERPDVEHVERNLDDMLQQILVMRANHAMFSIYGMDATKFLMRPMATLFSDVALARQILKELFVMRESSAAVYDSGGKTLKYVSTFRATFDDADRLNGILMATSKYDNGFKVRHNNKKK